VPTKQKRDEYSQVGLDNCWISHLKEPGYHARTFMLLTWSNVDLPITVALHEWNGKPVVSIWNERSMQYAHVTVSSWATLRSKLLLKSPGLLPNEAFVLMFEIQYGRDAPSWLQSTLPTYSETPDRVQFFTKTCADLLASCGASFKSFLSDLSTWQVLRG
jgi:hypothetical protein